MSEFEFVVVGGGSAGMALAARLSQAKRKTLLLEAGPEHLGIFKSWMIDMPAAYGYAYKNKAVNWMYEGEPEPHLNNRRMYQPRGKILGGSSSINGIAFLRAHPAVFDLWVERGAEGWSFADVLPYYRKLETWHGKPHPLRGADGPIHVKVGLLECPYYAAFLEAGQQAGHPFSEDINAASSEGVALFQTNNDGGVRASTAHAYRKYVADPDWLTIISRAHVTGLCFSGDRVTGVEYIRHGVRETAQSTGEVILSAGAYNSPQILMLSGLGPEEHLKQIGLRIRHRLEGVGENLQDHPIIYPKYESNAKVSPIKYDRWDRKLGTGLRWLLTRGGPAASNYAETVALLRSAPEVRYPDVEFQFCPLVLDHDQGHALGIHGWSNSCGPVAVEGRGWVKLRSSDPQDPPRILCNFLSTDRDVHLMRRAFELNRDLMAQPAMRSLIKDELEPGFNVSSRADVMTYLRQAVAGDYHPVGTCKIGKVNDPFAVVDSELRVHGVRGLRVADASVMPVIPNANTNATSIMIGERAADMMLGKAYH